VGDLAMTDKEVLDRVREIVVQYGNEYFSLNIVAQDRQGADYFELLYQHLIIMIGEIEDE
jgi:hypothetical protein